MPKVNFFPDVDLRLTSIPGGDAFLYPFADVAEHMLQTVVDATRLFKQLDDYNQKHATKILPEQIAECDFSDIALVMSIHDFYKPKQSSRHAEKGAEFLDNLVIGLIRHHDKFGTQHTGEASILALKEVVQWLATLEDEAQERALAMLPVVTMLDSGAFGFLNQPRVETYFQLKSSLRTVLKGVTELKQLAILEELARAETATRIQRLIQSNNRATIDIELVKGALGDVAELEDNLHRVRFDAGVYALEPLMLYLIHEKYDFPAPPAAPRILIDTRHRSSVVRFLGELDKLAATAVGKGSEIVDLGDRSLKPGANLEARRAAFDGWAETV